MRCQCSNRASMAAYCRSPVSSLRPMPRQHPQPRPCAPLQSLHCSRRLVRLQAAAQDTAKRANKEDDTEDLEDEMEAFLREQADRESGGALAVSEVQEKGKDVGTDKVSDADTKRYCSEILRNLRLLRDKRDMTLNEVKLTLAIEDPNIKEQRTYMDVETASGVSRDEIAAALIEVAEGRVPKDRLALRELHKEVMEWPYLDAEEELEPEGAVANYEGITETGGQNQKPLRPKTMKRDPNEKPQSVFDMLPDWVGYGVLYGISSAPIIIGVTVVVILFLNSLR